MIGSRRQFLSGVAGFILAGQGAAFGQDSFNSSAEWRQDFEGAPKRGLVRSSVPLLSQQTLSATEQAIAQYRMIVSNGGFVRVPNANLKLGSRGPAVVALRQRLAQSGDLEQASVQSQVFDSFVDAAVRRFQARHGFNQTGLVSGGTLNAMNVSADLRLRQLETNIVRLRSLAGGSLGPRYITTNIPAAQIETVENGVVQTRHTAVVGKVDRQSPVMTSRVSEINFHPFWTVPQSIIRKDLIPKMQVEPNYLTENRIRIYNQAGQEISPQAVNWNSMEAMNYRFRQDSGDFNSMGTVRINIPNPHGVYMHDTNSKGLFGDDTRFHSSGCIRVQNVRDYVAWILKDTPGWTRDKVEEAFRGGNRIDAKVASPVPVYWIYITAWGTPEGLIQFRDDIYGRDGLGPTPVARVQVEEEG